MTRKNEVFKDLRVKGNFTRHKQEQLQRPQDKNEFGMFKKKQVDVADTRESVM